MQTSIESNKNSRQGLPALFFIQSFSTFSYGVIYVSLVLFCVHTLHLPVIESNHLIASFIAFNYVLNLIAGFLGGQLLSFRILFLIGTILQMMGCWFIATVSLDFLYIGMAVFVVGSAMTSLCINCLIGQLFQPSDKHRDYAFLWNYSGMNIGFFIGVTTAGFFQSTEAFHELFLLAGVSNVLTILIAFVFWKKLADVNTVLSNSAHSRVLRAVAGMICIALLIFILKNIFIHAVTGSKIILAVGLLIAIMVVVITMRRRNGAEKKQLIAYCIFAMAALVYYAIYQLIPMGLTLFLAHNVNRNFLGMIIPPAWFLNIDTLTVIVGCPLLAITMRTLRKKGYHLNHAFFFSLGLFLIGLAMLILPLGIYFADSQGLVSMTWPVITYFLISFAEISLSPIGFAVVSELSPPDLRGLLMGIWLMVSGVAAIISNIFSNQALGATKSLSPLASNPTYSATFLHLGLSGIAMGIILWLLRKKLIA